VRPPPGLALHDPGYAENTGRAEGTRPANLSIGAVTMQEFGVNDGAARPGERIAPQFTVQNSGAGGGDGLRGSLRVLSGQGLSPQAPTRVFGSAGPGQSVTPTQYIPTLEIAPTCNTDFDAQVELTVVDVLGNSATAGWSVPVRCVGQVPVDAGQPIDSGSMPMTDAGSVVDAGINPDAAPWVRDSGVHPDAAAPWVRDSGVHPDASQTTTNPDLQERSGCQAGPGADGFVVWLLMGLFLAGPIRARRRRS
jgi:hypothetical protein